MFMPVWWDTVPFGDRPTPLAINQLHGNAFEDLLRPGFPGSAQARVDHQAEFDIAAEHDPIAHLPTSVKTTVNNTVGLADARRMFNLAEPFRLLVGAYIQKGSEKHVLAIHEFHITPAEWAQLKGDLPATEVAAFHEGIKAFGPGHHLAARTWARQRKAELAAMHPASALILNPKIDSRVQRRLQATILLTTLIKTIADYTCHRIHYRGQPLPMVLPGSARERHAPPAAVTPAQLGESGLVGSGSLACCPPPVSGPIVQAVPLRDVQPALKKDVA